MTKQHPITPPPELVEQWLSEHYGVASVPPGAGTSHVATEAARWGADQELEACYEWVRTTRFIDIDGHNALRLARRPEPPSLKEQALEALEALPTPAGQVTADRLALIRRALEALDD
jgi:hypothetical protein